MVQSQKKDSGIESVNQLKSHEISVWMKLTTVSNGRTYEEDFDLL